MLAQRSSPEPGWLQAARPRPCPLQAAGKHRLAHLGALVEHEAALSGTDAACLDSQAKGSGQCLGAKQASAQRRLEDGLVPIGTPFRSKSESRPPWPRQRYPRRHNAQVLRFSPWLPFLSGAKTLLLHPSPNLTRSSTTMSPNSSWKTRTGERGTLLGPLTTTAWSPPAGCGVHLVGCATCADGYQAQHCVGDAPQDFTGCWPPVASKVASPKYPYLGWGYYSPGLACPTGYTAACTATYGVRPDWPIQFDLFPSETAIGCCPSCVPTSRTTA